MKQIKTSSESVCDYKMYYHEICVNIVMDESDNQIGGPGFTVEIDKSKFGKRKYNCGRMIEGQWVLGGICREDRSVFLVTVPSRDRETLLPILKAKIKPGTTNFQIVGKVMTHLMKKTLNILQWTIQLIL